MDAFVAGEVGAENEMMVAAVEQMDAVVPWPAFPGEAGLQINSMLITKRDQILGGYRDIAGLMQRTQDEINALLH